MSLSIKLLTEDQVTSSYLNWMNDTDINKFLESKGKVYTLEDIKIYVKSDRTSYNNYLFGIYLDNNLHIGNIRIGSINFIHRYGSIGLLIGDKKQWGKGYASIAIKLAVDYAFNVLNLNKVTAAMYNINVAANNAFLKNGFRELGIHRNHVYLDGKYIDVIKMEKLNL